MRHLTHLTRLSLLGWVALAGWCTAQAAPATAVKPQRIVSLNLCTDQLLLQLVPRERIAALGWMSTNPENSALYQQARGLHTVRGSAEEVLALRPDLVLAGTATTRFTSQVLRDYGIPVLALPGADSFQEVYRQIRAVAQAVGEAERGETLVRGMQARAQTLADTHHRPQRWATPYWAGGRSAGQGTLYDDILRAAGFANGAAGAGLKGYGALPLEKVVALAPDILLTSDYKRNVPSQGRRLLQHPVLQAMGMRETTLPSRWMVCGGPWNLEAAALLTQQGAGT